MLLKSYKQTTMLKYKTLIFAGILVLLLFPKTSAKAFHKDIYYPRAPEVMLENLQDMDNPFSPTTKNLQDIMIGAYHQ